MTSDPDHRTGTTAIDIDIAIEADGWRDALPDPEAVMARAAEAALARCCPDLGPAVLSLLLTDDSTMRTLNKDWRGLDRPTNVLSFPATTVPAGATPQPEFAGVPLELGDIALGFETCAVEAAAAGKPLADHAQHLVVHGVLHLLGWDHQEEAEAERMEALETGILDRLGVGDPYAPGHRTEELPDHG